MANRSFERACTYARHIISTKEKRMSKHIFTVEVECDSSEDYEEAFSTLSSVGEVINEESDYVA